MAAVVVADPIAERAGVHPAFCNDALIGCDLHHLICVPSRLGRTNHATLLVHPDAHRHVDELIRGTDGVLDVDQGGVGGMGAVIPFARGCFPASILCRGDDFEILVLQLAVEFLPAWQIKTAASPGGPSDHQHLLSAKIG